MKLLSFCKLALGTTSLTALVGFAAAAETFDIPSGDLSAALDAYTRQTGVPLIIAGEAVKGTHTAGVKGDFSRDAALSRILTGTGFNIRHRPSGAVVVVPGDSTSIEIPSLQLAQATPARAAVETVTVTSSKLGGADVQSIPIAITALSQEQLTASQTNGGPDLIKQVPNMTFTKTNFSGYSIQIRGIGTQAISVTTDPAVAVAFNDIPFIRNHFFEQEFYDVGQVEVLRGPQGTLYGRNATAGVVNLVSAKPTDQFEAMASAEVGNYSQRRFEGMLNLPIVDDRLDLRFAGEWTKRQGYSFNDLTNNRIDGRDLWSGRMTIGFKPVDHVQAYLVWEHFQEDDDRMRTAKQLCKTDPLPTTLGGVPIPANSGGAFGISSYLSQGCQAESLYSPESFEVPNGYALPYYGPASQIGAPTNPNMDPYAGTTQSSNLRVISTTLDPSYKAKNDIVELNVDYDVLPALTFTSQSAYSQDFLWSTEDYNRFDTAPEVFVRKTSGVGAVAQQLTIQPDGVFCDPQLGCSSRLVAEDLNNEHSWQMSQEFRLASHLSGPLNFSVGGNYMHYETEENYYVFVNSLTAWAAVQYGARTTPWVSGVSDNSDCLQRGLQGSTYSVGGAVEGCIYIDPNPITKLNNRGHNYFLSQNPYVLNSYAGFGEVYYDIFRDLKLTGGVRWTEDRKHAPQFPSQLGVANSYGYPSIDPIDQQWDQITGRAAANWTPKLAFTDQTLIYGSYAHGYKAGGANPPPAEVTGPTVPGPVAAGSATHPATFKPEFIDAFELGTKNTLLDGALSLNGSLFYYNYENYQISEIVDRTALNQNFDAHVKGAEIEATYEPIPGLRFNFSGGYEDARLANGSKAIDLMDRTAGNPDWIVVKPFPTDPSNCIFPLAVIIATLPSGPSGLCGDYKRDVYISGHIDPLTNLVYTPNPTIRNSSNVLNYDAYFNPTSTAPLNKLGYPGFDPASAPNGGEGFDKDLSGNMMPNAPPFTISFGAQYSLPVTAEWAATIRGDFYWQDNSWWRVFNDMEYDKLHGYNTLNLTLILTSQNGWQVMLYDKNVFNKTAITGAFLNSDDSGLTTNAFLTDPKLIGVRVTKNW